MLLLEPEKKTVRSEGRRPTGRQVKIGPLKFEHWQIISILLAMYDYVAVCGAYFIALWSRFDGIYTAIPERYMTAYSTWCFPYAAVCVVIFYLFRM